ncbi:MAG TPA: toll/interleukin-1 receptor domain-containing protein [Gemmatimonadaceae bacterium]|nr:toll/interleukin-1 receptor domain-containing protein [Gemmatimonadaceae bacterium]
MQIFLSYASEDRPTAERICYALRAQRHEVFLDRDALAPGREFDGAIADALGRADLLVFLVAPESVARGRYTLSELALAERRWPHPAGHVLPVMLRPTPRDAIPAYLRAVTYLEPRGDVVAEVADAVRRLARGQGRGRLRGRAARLTLLAALAALAAAALGGGAAWRARGRRGFDYLSGDVRHRARAVAAVPGGYAVVAAAPGELLRFTDAGERVGEAAPLAGDPVAVARTPEHILVATRAPDGVLVIEAASGRVVDTVPLDAALIDGDTVGAARASRDIRSVAAAGGTIWVSTGTRDGAPRLLRLRQPGRRWVVPTWTVPPEPGFDARALRLRGVAGQLWAVAADETPSSLYRVEGNIRVDAFHGRDLPAVACARDLAPTESDRFVFLGCDDSLREAHAEGKGFVLDGARPISDAARRRGEVVVRDGAATFVALNGEREARVVRVDGAGSATLAALPGVAVTSMAVTLRAVIAVVRRADGSADALSIPRARRARTPSE